MVNGRRKMCKNEDIPHTLSFLFLFCFSVVVLRTEILEDLQVCPRKKQIYICDVHSCYFKNNLLICLFDLIVKLKHPSYLNGAGYFMFLIDVLIGKDIRQWSTLFQELRTERIFSLEENISIFTDDLKVTATL